MTLTEARPRRAVKTSTETETQLLAVWGPIGSTGKSTISLNLAYELALLGQRVLLLDLDTYCPSLTQLLPVGSPTSGLAGAARLIRQGRFTTEELDRLSVSIKHKRSNLSLLPGLANPSRWPELTPETVHQLVRVASLNFDFIVADISSPLEDELSSPSSPTSRNNVSRTTISISTQCLVILNETALSVSRYLGEFAILEELQKIRRLIVNRSDSNPQLMKALQTLTKERISAFIPTDEPAVRLAESQKLPLALARRKAPARNALAALAHKLLAWPSVN
jgi:MinD-like ATPase involved in chromosome partitioning or flagellar assembly